MGAVAVARRSRRRFLRRPRWCSWHRLVRAAALVAAWHWAAALPWRRLAHSARRRLYCAAALATAWRSAIALPWRQITLPARCVVLGGSRSLRVLVGAVASSLGAVAVARRSQRRCLRHRAGAPGAGLVVPPRSRRHGARPPLFHGRGSLSQGGRLGRPLCLGREPAPTPSDTHPTARQQFPAVCDVAWVSPSALAENLHLAPSDKRTFVTSS